MNKRLLTGLIAAPFTPMHEDGSLNLQVIGPYAEFLMQKKCVTGVFICGTTGESVSLTTEERKAVAEKWMEAAKGKTESDSACRWHVAGSVCRAGSPCASYWS